jgi:Na+-translocating ferredoxin:NAD+ oxidoreductase RnfE subunit
MVLPAGGFITAGILMALFNYLDGKVKDKLNNQTKGA